ncbi:Relaxase/Mobilisation nuclease domain-containing protein [Desulfomicrobium norvegicum]|uniref:Relaxase/Mobilisation nuclease domain-containing protein n=2 Tax=Desulfomicrobium norvegicum (strain DSM 1741 / NCIMB 8310) TaxID=52561 RepID=A0A8G2C6Z6_DESNO|nr:Relaxase/Mobilisation nuclease domain-containing protein [Desulfomicrobium norvegicum]
MKGMQKIQRGSGFRGCADYLFDHDGGRVIGGNMDGLNARALATEFGIARRLRPDIEKPVWHNSLRLPADERAVVDDQKWREIGDDYMYGMGFSDQHQRVYVLHNGHIHILANRVGLDGKVYLGRNENLRSTGLIQRLEQVHGLTVTKGVKKTEKGRIAPPEVRKTRVGERRRYERLEDMTPRERLQQLVAEAAQGRPTASEFVARLQAHGVSVWPKVTSSRKLDGFSFGLGGVAFTGNQLGDRYRWGQLQKAGVHYDPARDLDALTAPRPTGPVVIAEVATVEVEAEVEQERPTIAEGLDLTPEQMAEARRQEEESRELEEILGICDGRKGKVDEELVKCRISMKD